MFDYKITAKNDRARTGIFSTPHGELITPVFAPVGTQATVKTLTPGHLEEINASLVLSNTYHLYLRPGDELVRDMGGLHRFMQWHKPMLTDSGGFQVFSLSQTRKVDEEGVTFKSHIDGSIHRFTPEKSIAIQENLGADIIMAFDECSDPNDLDYIRQAMERTHRWAERSLEAKTRPDQALFGIVQGGIDPTLRTESAKFIASLDTPGIAIGGLSVGETKKEMHDTLDVVTPLLPEDKPRYLMGVGTPEDLINGVLRGIDIFDCVLPTRLARHHSAFSPEGRLNLMNASFARDGHPIDETCDCYSCRTFTRSYIRHLIVAKELLAGTLISIHNLRALIRLMENIRVFIADGSFESRAPELLRQWSNNAKRAEIGAV
ncbi:MAG: tRNA guanosine(34) transglycosylase Tgt [Chloroflexi bacterium]|nr:MAG: tRNA guanosine(34) transglycosylase Tgt [Chloroflexota bacterium]MCE7859098.1 tRNA guanosine(34) transglycosylase Tgt [Chloroflexi bacterium CFX2]